MAAPTPFPIMSCSSWCCSEPCPTGIPSPWARPTGGVACSRLLGRRCAPTRRALELSSTAIVLVHNHPSGDPTPSRADFEMTKQIVGAAKNLGIVVHDHIIVGKQGHASFRGLGLI